MTWNPWKLRRALIQVQLDRDRMTRALLEIADQEKETSNATVKRMARIAKQGLK